MFLMLPEFNIGDYINRGKLRKGFKEYLKKNKPELFDKKTFNNDFDITIDTILHNTDDKVTEEIIKVYDCAQDVENELGIRRTSVTTCCRGRYKTAGFQASLPSVWGGSLFETAIQTQIKSSPCSGRGQYEFFLL